MRKAGTVLALLAVVSLGVALRVVKWREWPGGPWIDEVYFLRAARLVDARPDAPLFGTSPLVPPDFTDRGNLYPTHVYLRVVAEIDRLAGGGIPTLRAMSIAPALLLFLGSLLVAWEATRRRPAAFLPAGVLLATSLWLLSPGRWACDVVSTSALLVGAAGVGLTSARTGSRLAAVLAGVLLGLAQYGYVQSRMAFLAPLVLVAYAALRRRRELLRVAATVALAAAATAAPHFLHLLGNPDRATTHTRELFIFTRPPAGAVAALTANVRDYAALFTHRGDVNARHGDSSRPVVLPGVAALFAAGLALAARRDGPERFLALVFGLFLAAALLARDLESANASRLSPAAPFVLVLAALAGADIVERLGRRHAAGLAALWAIVLVSSALDVVAFVRWASAPWSWGPFGVPERDLADAVAAERTRNGPAELVLHPVTGARNVYVVDVLLGRPGDGARHAVATAALEGSLPWAFVPAGDVLYAADAGETTGRTVAALGGGVVAARRYPAAGSVPGPEWALYRIPSEGARRAAAAVLATYPVFSARASGNLDVPGDGLYELATVGGVRASLDGQPVFPLSPDGPGAVVVRLATGPHEIRWSRIDPRGRLTLRGPDGFVIPLEAP